MGDWLHELPLIWMALIVFSVTYLFAILVQTIVGMLAIGERARAFKAVSAGMTARIGATRKMNTSVEARMVVDHATRWLGVRGEAAPLNSSFLL